MSPLVLAHIGHWTSLLPFFGPVLVLPLGLYAVVLLDRRGGRLEDDEDEEEWPVGAA